VHKERIPPLRMCLALCQGHAHLADVDVLQALRALGWAPVLSDGWGPNDPQPHVIVRCEDAGGASRLRTWDDVPLVSARTGAAATPSERADAWHRAAIAALNLLYAPADSNQRGRL
jgi:hypothetical protein